MSRWFRKRSTSPVAKVASHSLNTLSIVVAPPEPNIDIIAVHGLNPLNNPTHALSTWTADGKLWLRDFMPKRAPRARILLYGYNANVAFGAGSAGVREQGECLLDQIAKTREHCLDRPIIFIAHSLGGIIVKRALVHAKSDASYENILASTFGLVFFGTPHKGGNRANLGAKVADIVRTLVGNPRNTFMEALRSDSLFLEILADDFRQLLEQFLVLSFYETRPLSRFGMVVDKDSATLGLAGTREKQIPIDADHRQICKFDSDDNPRFLSVMDNIISMINEAVAANKRRINAPDKREIGNFANIEGSQNCINQMGKGNQGNTVGVGNNTDQFGRSNSCEVRGEGNSTVQIEMAESDALKYAEIFLARKSGAGVMVS